MRARSVSLPSPVSFPDFLCMLRLTQLVCCQGPSTVVLLSHFEPIAVTDELSLAGQGQLSACRFQPNRADCSHPRGDTTTVVARQAVACASKLNAPNGALAALDISSCVSAGIIHTQTRKSTRVPELSKLSFRTVA